MANYKIEKEITQHIKGLGFSDLSDSGGVIEPYVSMRVKDWGEAAGESINPDDTKIYKAYCESQQPYGNFAGDAYVVINPNLSRCMYNGGTSSDGMDEASLKIRTSTHDAIIECVKVHSNNLRGFWFAGPSHSALLDWTPIKNLDLISEISFAAAGINLLGILVYKAEIKPR